MALRDFWDRISSRERALIVVLGVVIPVALAIWLGLSIRDGLVEREARNEQTRDALEVIARLKAKGPQATPVDDVVIPTEPIALETYVTKAADKSQLKFKGSIDTRKKEQNGFVTQTVTVALDDISTDQLKSFLYEVENGNKTVAVTRLEVRQDFRDKKKIDVSFDISAYSKKPPAGGGEKKEGDDKGSAPGGEAAKKEG